MVDYNTRTHCHTGWFKFVCILLQQQTKLGIWQQSTRNISQESQPQNSPKLVGFGASKWFKVGWLHAKNPPSIYDGFNWLSVCKKTSGKNTEVIKSRVSGPTQHDEVAEWTWKQHHLSAGLFTRAPSDAKCTQTVRTKIKGTKENAKKNTLSWSFTCYSGNSSWDPSGGFAVDADDPDKGSDNGLIFRSICFCPVRSI